MKIQRKLLVIGFCTLFAALIPAFYGFGSAPAKWIEKTFSYDIENEYWQYPPVIGLEVEFGQGEQLLWTKSTDALGQVHFGSGLVDGTYWMNWSWGGEEYHEEVTINCSRLLWQFENYLPAKGV